MSDIEVKIDASPKNPRVVEVSGEEIANIIMKVAHPPAYVLAVRAANEICDYLAACHAQSRSLM